MVATTNLPGSHYFRYFIGSKSECRDWLDKRAIELQEECGGCWYNAYGPGLIESNKKAKTWEYLDGRKVINF